jgi:hypothetical protein
VNLTVFAPAETAESQVYSASLSARLPHCRAFQSFLQRGPSIYLNCIYDVELCRSLSILEHGGFEAVGACRTKWVANGTRGRPLSTRVREDDRTIFWENLHRILSKAPLHEKDGCTVCFSMAVLRHEQAVAGGVEQN